ncbi:MAG: hypothetical protein E6K65_00165 [Nitrospirae bacterium]|nr:MAG: hypothetical protein E6K65_00165 [Nitrospirota bacterium]
MTSLDEVDRKLSQVLKEIQTIQVDLKSIKRAVNESNAADVGMASMTAELAWRAPPLPAHLHQAM